MKIKIGEAEISVRVKMPYSRTFNDDETVVHLINQNAKAKHHVNIGVDAEDYYRIKDSEKEENR